MVLAVAQAPAQTHVDAALVLAADVSISMTDERVYRQYIGYAAAFRSPEVIAAITGGFYGAVAVTFVEWAGQPYQHQAIGWTLIDSAEGALAFAHIVAKLGNNAAAYRPGVEWTSISSALDFCRNLLLDRLPFAAERKIIDLSSDGVQNDPRDPWALARARAAAIDNGITINALPIQPRTMATGIAAAMAAEVDIVEYFENQVIGGPNAFLIEAKTWKEFPEALRRKLVLELAGLVPEDAPPPPRRPRAG